MELWRGTNDDDFIFAGPGDDKLIGRGGSDKLHANGGSDVLVGGAGNDMLDPGNDLVADFMAGGPGRDEYNVGDRDRVYDNMASLSPTKVGNHTEGDFIFIHRSRGPYEGMAEINGFDVGLDQIFINGHDARVTFGWIDNERVLSNGDHRGTIEGIRFLGDEGQKFAVRPDGDWTVTWDGSATDLRAELQQFAVNHDFWGA